MTLKDEKINEEKLFISLIQLCNNLNKEDTHWFIKLIYGILLNRYERYGLKRLEFYELKIKTSYYKYLESMIANSDTFLDNIISMIEKFVTVTQTLTSCGKAKKFSRALRRLNRSNSLLKAGICIPHISLITTVSYNSELKNMFDFKQLDKPHNMLNTFLLNFGSMNETLFLMTMLLSNSRSNYFKKYFRERGVVKTIGQLFSILFDPKIDQEISIIVRNFKDFMINFYSLQLVKCT